MSVWKEVTLQDVVTVLGDGLHGTPKHDENGEYYFINGSNLSNGKIVIDAKTRKTSAAEYEKYKKDLNSRTILVSINGTLGNVALYDNEKCVLGKSACYFNVEENVDKLFIKYVVTNRHFQEYISLFAHGTTIKNVSLKTMREYPFALPPSEEQEAIAAVLASLDDKIDLLHRQNKTLEALAQTLFRHWFIDGAEDDWESVALGEVVTTISGGTPSRKKMAEFYENGEILWVKSKELNGSFITETEEKITKKALKKSSAKLLPKKTVLIAMYGATVGEYSILSSQATCNQAVCALLPNENYPFTFLFMLAKNRKDELINMAVGSAQQNISQALIKSLNILSPSPRIHLYHKKVEPLFEKIEANILQAKTLEKLRDALLPKLMSGEVRVKS